MDEILTDEFLTEFGEQIREKAKTAINAALADVEPSKPKQKPKNLYDAVIQLDALKKREDLNK